MNPVAILTAALVAVGTDVRGAIRIPVPVIRQAPERCGPAALAMVFRYHGAAPPALEEAERAYDPVLRGSLITDLAAAARRAGFAATVAQVPEDSLLALLDQGLPPILLYRRGPGVVSVGHFGVVVGWDPERRRYIVHDGSAKPRAMARDALMNRWRAAGALALVVR
ncbi:MAG: cysteine peptidase family C39 domain-containing protein, partial [Candidatus Eiseniibacteriota bacterium]